MKRQGRLFVSVLGAGILLAGAACSSSSGTLTSSPTTEDGGNTPAVSNTEAAPPATNTATPEQALTTAELVELISASVVRVALPTGVGSGFIIDASGYIITNNHVVESAPQSVEVTLADGSIHSATVVGRDPRSDLAVLKIDAPGEDLLALDLADLDETKVGEDVVAIGFALDLTDGSGPPSVTRGIVSALNREIETSGILGAVQTDAAINHGNSGGPLVNYRGEVVGVNTSLAPDPTTGGIAQNVGFAVGAETIAAVFEEILETGTVDRALLGVGGQGAGAGFSEIRPAEAEDLGLPRDTRGVLIGPAGVSVGGPSELAGMQGNDLIVRIGDYEIADESDLAVAMIAYDPGDTVEVDVYRDGELLTLDVTLGSPTNS